MYLEVVNSASLLCPCQGASGGHICPVDRRQQGGQVRASVPTIRLNGSRFCETGAVWSRREFPFPIQEQEGRVSSET